MWKPTSTSETNIKITSKVYSSINQTNMFVDITCMQSKEAWLQTRLVG